MNYDDQSNMNRDKWEFEYTAKVLADAAASKCAYRLSRIKWWEGEKAKLMVEVKESGLEISEDLAQSYTSNAGNAPQLKVKPELQKKITESHSRILKHTAAEREYDGWVQVLNANPESRLKLKHGDWLFFFGKD